MRKSGNFGLKSNGKVIFRKFRSDRPFPSSLVALFQSESKSETVVMKMTLICMKMKLHAELIFIWKVSHLDSFKNRGTRELGNGLLWNTFRGTPLFPFGTARHKLPYHSWFAKLSSFQSLISRKQLREIEAQIVSAISLGWLADSGKTLTIIQRSSQPVYSDKW